MSANNLILVVRYKRRYYVMFSENADTQWDAAYALSRIKGGCQSTYDRGRALRIGHNMQYEHETEYGVRELWI